MSHSDEHDWCYSDCLGTANSDSYLVHEEPGLRGIDVDLATALFVDLCRQG